MTTAKSTDEKNKEESSVLISPLSISIGLGVIFIVFTFFLILIVNLTDNPVVDYYSYVKYNFVVFCIVFAILLSFIYGIMYVVILRGKNHKKALQFISAIIAVTIGFTFFVTSIPGNVSGGFPFVKVFENSIGYFIVSSLYGTKLNEIFQFNDEVLNKYPTDKKVLLTTFNINNFEELTKVLMTNGEDSDSSDFNFTMKEEGKAELFKMVLHKNVIGLMSWYYISSFMTAISSLRYLILL